MRKFLCGFVLLFILAQAAPALADVWPRWVRPRNRQVVVQFERTRVSATMWAHAKAAMADWSRSGRVEAVPVAKCTNPYAYCVKVYEYSARDGRAGHTELYADPRTHRAWYGKVSLNLYYLRSWTQRRKTSCHEVGHAVGAVHRDGLTCMRQGMAQAWIHPSSADFAYLQRIYALPG